VSDKKSYVACPAPQPDTGTAVRRRPGGQARQEISLYFSRIQMTSGAVVFCFDRTSNTGC
jgi:hypothetical protein